MYKSFIFVKITLKISAFYALPLIDIDGDEGCDWFCTLGDDERILFLSDELELELLLGLLIS